MGLRDLCFLRIIYFILTCVHVSSLMLSSEYICYTRLCKWDTQRNWIQTDIRKWVPVSLDVPFTCPCATYVLRRKQLPGNMHVFKNEPNNTLKNTNLLVDPLISKY